MKLNLREVFIMGAVSWLLCVPGALKAGISSGKGEFGDGNFESSTANGIFPDSGFWKPAWLGEAGAVCTLSAGRTGHGLWVYTGQAPTDTWSGTYQEVPASAGRVFRAVAWIRTPDGEPWVEGSVVQLQVRFLDAAGRVLVQISSEPLSTKATEWQRHALVTSPAPKGASLVQFVCRLGKPVGKGGQSVANFDDCWLGEVSGSEDAGD
jgi:hypothetical protein